MSKKTACKWCGKPVARGSGFCALCIAEGRPAQLLYRAKAHKSEPKREPRVPGSLESNQR
jgi:hypothetical protein